MTLQDIPAFSRSDLSLTSNGRFRMAVLMDLTSFLNGKASEMQGAILKKLLVNARFQISNIQDLQAYPRFGIGIIRSVDTAVITTTEGTTSNDLGVCFEEKIDTSFEVKFLKSKTKRDQIFYHDTGTTWAHHDLNISWVVPKSLQKWGEGGVSEEMKDTSTMRLFLVAFVYTGVPATIATTIYVVGQLVLQYSVFSNINTGFNKFT